MFSLSNLPHLEFLWIYMLQVFYAGAQLKIIDMMVWGYCTFRAFMQLRRRSNDQSPHGYFFGITFTLWVNCELSQIAITSLPSEIIFAKLVLIVIAKLKVKLILIDHFISKWNRKCTKKSHKINIQFIWKYFESAICLLHPASI